MANRRAALVTNVLHFVGAPAARALIEAGLAVACHDRAFAEPARRDAFAADHANLNVLDAADPEAAVAAVEALAGPLDVLVCNDFFPAIRAPIDEARVDDLRRGLDDLVIAPFQFAAAAARRMKARRRGKIILVTSAAPFHGLPNYSMYVAGRGAANALTVSLAKELAPFNIQVNAVAPNYVESPSYFPPALVANAEAMKKFAAKVPLGRLGTPEEVAAAIAFLASDGSNFITGHVMPVAGGWA
jgi:NAD(P)-dependent dehydrogenase (short-subunit alcohol dehydrogenase family)